MVLRPKLCKQLEIFLQKEFYFFNDVIWVFWVIFKCSQPKAVLYLKKASETMLVAESVLAIVPFIFSPSGRDLKDKSNTPT